MYVNSPGGGVVIGLAIYDTMQYLKCDVSTTCVGLAASMASVILAGGTKGKRFALPNSEILIHQPWSSGGGGQATDIAIQAAHIVQTKERLAEIIAKHAKQTKAKVMKDFERDKWMLAEEALSYGLIDRIVKKR